MSADHYHVTPTSANAKTGKILVTTSTAKTCPPACPFRRGCYAKGGPLALHWAAVSRGERGLPWRSFLRALADALALKGEGATWRHNQAGDLPGCGDRIDVKRLDALVAVNAAAKARGFTYTHKPVTTADAGGDAALAAANLAAIQAANAAGLTINLSANSLAHADALADVAQGRAPICAVVPHDAPDRLTTPAGRRAVVCPAQVREDVTCATCRLCSRAGRSVVVAFRAHGAAARHAEREGGAS
jgi:hypothetical protein